MRVFIFCFFSLVCAQITQIVDIHSNHELKLVFKSIVEVPISIFFIINLALLSVLPGSIKLRKKVFHRYRYGITKEVGFYLIFIKVLNFI